ncbi:MAG: hypothetical protein ABL871_07575 [Terricaulis sp.]
MCEQRFRAHGLNVLARVRDSERAFDLALGSKERAQSVVRCVMRAESSDYHALKTMLAEGDFDRAAIVYAAEGEAFAAGEIETYPLSRIDELAASLARESHS